MDTEYKSVINSIRKMNENELLSLITFFKSNNIDEVLSKLETEKNLSRDLNSKEKIELSKNIQIIKSLNNVINK